MRVLLSWLREFVPIDVDPEALAERLSTTGLTVDGMTKLGAGISGVIVGEVRAVEPHPDADSLMLVRAFDGTAERDIVCGARNYVVGDRVPMALPGARLPDGMEIAQRVVRGAPSDGMLCSARELAIAEDHSGILLLDRDAPLGKDIVAALELDDVLYELDVTPNRPDCLSVVGVAREIAAMYGLPFTIPTSDVPETSEPVETLTRVRIDDPLGAPRYLARVAKVTLGRSPWWMRRRLLASGVRPISNVVDVTNYVLLERGHPLHAFDLDTLRGAQIVVRKAKRGETITTLDGQERALVPADVVIADAERPVAVAGIMGGAETEVSDSTTRILLESAYFEPKRIRPTANRLGLRTEASVRFERGADPEGVPAAADRAAALLVQVADARIARGSIDLYPRPVKRKAVRLRVARATGLIGEPQDSASMAATLGALGCSSDATKSALRVTPPSWRPDITIEEDLIEEVLRLTGYDRVRETLPAGGRTGGLTREQQLRRRVHSALLGAGLNEIQTLSLISPSSQAALGLDASHPMAGTYRVANPLSEEESVLRGSLLPGLLQVAARNVARRVLPVTLFEVGTIFRPRGETPNEERWAGWLLTGPAPEGWHQTERTLDFYDAKGVLETLAASLGLDLTVRAAPAEFASALFHPGRCALVLLDDVEVGVLAEIHPARAVALELPERVAVGLLHLDAAIAAARDGVSPPVPRFPSMARDVALVVPDDVPATTVLDALRGAGGDLLEQVEVFDRYQGEPVPPGHVSLAFALAFRASDRTLTDADADAALRTIREAAGAAGWAVRD